MNGIKVEGYIVNSSANHFMTCNFDEDDDEEDDNADENDDDDDDNADDRNIAYSKAGNFMTCTFYGMHCFGTQPRPTIL